MIEGKPLRWNAEKDAQLQQDRGIGFEIVAQIIEEFGFLEITEHPNQEKYPSQKMLVIKINDYVYLVPCVEDDNYYFLKTIFPSRKMTKKYLGK